MGTKTMAHVFFVVLSLFAMLSTAQAEEFPPDKFKLAFGGYALVRFDSSISLTEPNLGAGISISPQDMPGLDIDNTVLRIEGYYRFRPRHALTYSWYSINSEGTKTVEEDFEWVDEDGNTIIIPFGAQIISTLDYDIFKVGYLWSFHHTDKVEMGAGLSSNSLEIEEDDPKQQLRFDNTISGGLLYVATYF